MGEHTWVFEEQPRGQCCWSREWQKIRSGDRELGHAGLYKPLHKLCFYWEFIAKISSMTNEKENKSGLSIRILS